MRLRKSWGRFQAGVKLAPPYLGDSHHLVERRGDEAGEAEDLRAVLFARVEDFVARAHHADVDNLKVGVQVDI